MFCPIKYSYDKIALREYYFQNKFLAKHHKNKFSEIPYWFKLFSYDHLVTKIISDLNLNRFNILPRFSFQLKNTRLPSHIDIDRIVGINFNLMNDPATIHIEGHPFIYEAALIDVGAKIHSVEPIEHDRLVLKLAIRAPWDDIFHTLLEKNYIDDKMKNYKSNLLESEKQFVKI